MPDGNWALKEPMAFPVTQESVDPLLRGISKLTANGFPDTMPATPSEAGFDKPKLKVRAERLDGSGIELVVGRQAWDGTYYAKPADRDWIYKIATYRVDPYYKNLMEMKAAPAVSGAGRHRGARAAAALRRWRDGTCSGRSQQGGWS